MAGSFGRYDQYAVNRIDECIELWTYTLCKQDLLAVDLVSREGVPSTKDKPQPPVTRLTKAKLVPPPKAAYDVDRLRSKMSSTTKVLFELLRDQIMALGDDVTERPMNQYVGYRRLKNFTEIVGMKSKGREQYRSLGYRPPSSDSNVGG